MSGEVNAVRRRLLQTGALAVGASAVSALSAGSVCQAFAAAAPALLAELGHGQVQLRDGPLARQARENHRLILGLDEDALLRGIGKINIVSQIVSQRDP